MEKWNFMKKMKCFILFLLILFITPAIVWAQGTITTNFGSFGVESDFTIDFSNEVLPAAISPPSGDAFLFTNNNFLVRIFLGTNEATDAWLLQMNGDGSFSRLIEFTNETGAYILDRTLYEYYQTWDITSSQITNLGIGQWYAEVDFGTATLLGEIIPVPEPSSSEIFLSGIGFFIFCFASRKMIQYCRNQWRTCDAATFFKSQSRAY